MIWFLFSIIIVLLDQVSKYLIITKINYGDGITIIDRFFYIVHWINHGAAWGILQNARLFFIPVTIIVSGFICYYILKAQNKLLRLSLSMILGGALGNFIDRVFRDGGVIDFLDFHFGSYHFPTFNVADSFVVVGTILLSYYMLFLYEDKKQNEKLGESLEKV